jgi:hypothetical protein
MQAMRALRNWFPSPASSDVDPSDAFHLPSGEQAGSPLQGVFPRFGTWNVLTVLPTFASVVAVTE